MKRVFWVAVGATVGALVVRKLGAKAAQLTPKGLAEQAAKSASGLGGSLRAFADDVRAGITERENELQAALLESDHRSDGPNGQSGLDATAAARLARDPDARWAE